MSSTRLPTPPHDSCLPGEMVDALAEVTVLGPPDPGSRATAIHAILLEIAETLQWRHHPDQPPSLTDNPHCPELVSFEQVLAAAEHHRDRMRHHTNPHP